MKDTTGETAKQKGCIGQGVREGMDTPPSQHLDVFTNLEAVQAPRAVAFREVSSHGHD